MTVVYKSLKNIPNLTQTDYENMNFLGLLTESDVLVMFGLFFKLLYTTYDPYLEFRPGNVFDKKSH